MIQGLDVSRTAAFGPADVSGVARASITIGNDQYGALWTVRRIVTTGQVTNPGTQVQLDVYKDAETPRSRITGSYSGLNDASGGTPIELRSGQRLIFVWATLTDPGSGTVTVSILGDVDNPRR